MLNATQFQERYDAQLLIELTDPNGAAVDTTKLQHALDDAWNEIQGYTFRLSESATPSETTLESHQVVLTMYRLASNRPGTEFESIAARYKASIRWLESLEDDKGDLGIVAEGTADAPIFERAELDDFGDLGVSE